MYVLDADSRAIRKRMWFISPTVTSSHVVCGGVSFGGNCFFLAWLPDIVVSHVRVVIPDWTGLDWIV
jgi:hypothetical protein